MNPKEIPDTDLDAAFYAASDGFLSGAAADEARKAQEAAGGDKKEQLAYSIGELHNVASLITKEDKGAQDAWMQEYREIAGRILKEK